MRVLAVDYGTRRTGLAISDFTGTIASPLEVIHEKNFNTLVGKIVKVAVSNQAERIVVGNPINMNGTKGEKSEICERFTEKLRIASGLHVELWDERLTTVSATAIMNQNNRRGNKRRETIDSVAAAIILEGYLSFLKNGNSKKWA
ncbi:MAG: Holliday junction resolvase RuvX [Oscillospiraceae bacterium]|nr:Holliday junction resolvase RuvX [Oscillospiraceae bacterium]